MLIADETTLAMISSPVRKIEARVEMYENKVETEENTDNISTLVNTFSYDGALISFSIERLGDESKFFGFGVFQKINIKLIDINREFNITTSNYFKVIYTIAGEDIVAHPVFYVTEVNRDENTNELSITAYDALDEATEHTAEEIALPEAESYTVEDYLTVCSSMLGLANDPVIVSGVWQNLSYTDTTEINIGGAETIRDILDDIAEIAGAIYYIDSNNTLCFKRLGGSALPINKAGYIELNSGDNRKLTSIIHSTDLEDNLTAATGSIGSTQYLRSNIFIELNVDNTVAVLNDLIDALGDFTINQFSCNWRGNPLLEVGDAVELTTKDNNAVISYVINDTINFNGSLSQSTSWSYTENTEETAAAPVTLGEALKQTIAKVDKANNEITLLAKSTDEKIEDVSGDIKELTTQVEAKLNSEEFTIKITEALNNVEGISTKENKFTFNDAGLSISRSDSEISTLIDEDGMDISKGDEKVLTADNTGVNAINLTARQYLIIGTRSRLEDYGSNRTGCFWIGG